MRSILLMSCLFCCFLTPQHAKGQQKINEGTHIQKPESVATDGKFYYIADIGHNLDPGTKDGDGVIWKMDLQGKIPGDTAFVKGLNAPKGAVLLNGIVFVTDIDRVVGYDTRTGKKLYDIDCSSAKTAFLNDLTVKDAKTLLVSAMDINKLFIIHLSEQPAIEELILTSPIKGPNGLAYDSRQNKLYVCSFVLGEAPAGELGYIDLNSKNPEFTRLIERKGHYDGLAIAANGMILVSDWVAFEKKGIVLSVDPVTANTQTINREPIAGPADFTLNAQGDLIVPGMMESAIWKIPAIR